MRKNKVERILVLADAHQENLLMTSGRMPIWRRLTRIIHKDVGWAEQTVCPVGLGSLSPGSVTERRGGFDWFGLRWPTSRLRDLGPPYDDPGQSLSRGKQRVVEN